MRISDWSSDVCSSDLLYRRRFRIDAKPLRDRRTDRRQRRGNQDRAGFGAEAAEERGGQAAGAVELAGAARLPPCRPCAPPDRHGAAAAAAAHRSDEHTSELQSLIRNSYAVFCLKTKKPSTTQTVHHNHQTTSN